MTVGELEALISKHGTWSAASEATGIPAGTLRGYASALKVASPSRGGRPPRCTRDQVKRLENEQRLLRRDAAATIHATTRALRYKAGKKGSA